MRVCKWLIWITAPIVIIMIGASLLTSHTYMWISEGRYATHEDIDYDYTHVSRKLIDYLNYRHDDLTFGAHEDDEHPIMSEAEIHHMEDVRDVYTLLRIIAGVSLVILLTASIFLYQKDKRTFYEAYRDIFYFPAFFGAFVGGWFLIDFNRAFDVFHRIFFEEGTWRFGGEGEETLITLVPESFWLMSGLLVIGFLILVISFSMFMNHRFMKPRIPNEGGPS